MLALLRKMASTVNISHASGTSGTVTRPGLPAMPELRSAARGDYRFYLAAAAVPGTVPNARRAARQTLIAWGLGHIASDAELVLGELLTNAVQASQAATAAGQMVAVYLALETDRLFVLVWDSCPLPPVHRGPASDDAETGRGLEIVSLIADRWDTAIPDDGGKVVWAQLNRIPTDHSAPAGRTTIGSRAEWA